MAYQRADNAKADKFPAPASASDNKAEQDQTQDPPVNVTVKPKLSADAKGAILLKKPESQICCTIDSAKKGLTLHFRFNIEAQALQEEKSRGEAKPEAPSNESDKPDEPADDNAEGSGEAGAGEEAENEAAEQPRPGLPICPEIATCTDRSEAHQVFYRHNEPEGGSNAKEEGKQEAEKSEGFATAARVAGGSGSLQDTTKVSGSASQGDTKRKKSDKQIFSFTCGSTEICLRAFPMSGDALEIGCSLNVSDAGGEEEPKSVESLLAAVDLGNKVEDFIANGWDVVDDLIMCAKSNDGTAWDEFWKNGLPLDSDESKRLRTYCQRLGKREAVGEVTVPNGSNGDWTSVAIRLNSASSSEDSMEVFINGNRCYPFPHANVSMETKGDPQCKLVFPGEVDMKLRELFVWERSLMLPQIKDLTKSSALSYLTAHTELADALIKRGEVVADLPFLPSRLPSTISLLGPVSTTKTADVLEANSEKFKSFEVPEGSALELKDKRLEFGPSKDYTLDLDFVVNYSKVKLGAGRFIPLVQFDAQGAKIMLDTASRSLAIICKVRHRTSSGLTNAEVRDHSWYRLRVYSSPKAVKVHLNAKPVLTLDWPLSPGMKVFRVISGSKGNSRPRMWEIGTLLSCRRKQGEEWSLNVKWFKERNKKKGEVIWPAGDVVVIDDSKTSGEEPKNGMNVMARLEGHDGYKWAQGVISNAEPMGSKMHWTLDLTIPINLRPLTVGDKVQAQYHGGKYYNGQIAAVNGDGTYNVDFDDGDKEEGLRPDQIKRKGDSMPMRKRPYKVNIKPGESRSVYLLPADSTSSIANVPNVQGEPQGEEEGMSEDEGGFGFGEGGGRFGGGRPAINMEMLTFAREANPEVFNTLQGMGFPELHCCRAIVEGQGSVQRAVDWAIGNQPQDDYLFFGSGGEGPPKDKNKSSDDNPSAGGDSAGAAASTGGEEEKANTEAGEDGGSGELENDVRRVLLTLDDPDMKSSKKEPFEIETNVEMELFLNHDFTLTGPLVLFGASSSLATLRKADTAAALAASAVSSAGSGASFCVKWLRIGLGKKGASKVSAPLDAKDNTWQWLPTGLPATMENQLIELLSRTERAEGFEPEVVHQALIHSSFDLATAWQMLQERDSLETIKSEIAMSKATKKQAMLQALGYPTKESRDALMESKYDTQTAVLRLLGQSMPDTAEKEVAGWDIPKDFVSPNELKPLSIKPMDAAARDGLSAAGKFGTPTPELWTSVTNKDWDRHHDDLETLKTLPLSKVKLALLHTESALTTHYGVVCALKAMQVADKEKVKDNALRIFDDDEPLGADAKASRRPPQQPFYIRLLRLVHLSENAIHMSIFRSVIASVLDSQIRSLEQRAKSVEEKTAPLSLVRSTVAVASEMSSESILHSLGYYSAQGRGDSKLMANAGKPGAMINDEGVRVKLGTKGTGIGQYYCGRKLGRTAIPGSNGTCGPADGPQCESCLRYQLEQGPTDGSFIGARAMVQFEERDRYLLRVVVGAEETSDGKWTLSVHSKNSTSLVNYTYPDGSNRILILPMPPIPVPTVGMRLVGRHGSWYPGQITHCEAKADGRFSVKLRYDDGDTSKLDYPIPAHAVVRRSVRNPIILLGDEWGMKTCKKPPSKSKSRASIGEQITPNAEKAKDAVSNPSIDLAFWITDLLLDVSDTYPDLARHLHPYLFPNSFQRIIFKVVRGGGSQDEEMTRVKLINTLAKIIRRFGLSFLREKNIEELANAMQTLFVAHSDNSENLKPVLEVTVKKTPFGATFDNNSCIVSSVTPNTDAAKAGLKKGYRLCRINGNEVFNYNQEEELRNTPLPFTIIFKADPLRNLEASPLLMACVELNLSIAVRREGKSMPQACKNEWFEGLVAAANVLDIIQPLTLGSAQSLRLLPDPVATIWSREVMRTWPGIEPVMRMMNPMSDGRNKFEVVLKEISEAKDIKDVKAQYDSLSWLIECEADDAQESAARVMTLLCSTLERRNLKNSDKVFIAEQLMSLARNQPHCANWISTNIDMITPAVVFLDQQAKDSKKDTWTVGMVVRATYKRGTQVYKGIIRRVNGDGTYSIKYDDGDIWDDAPASAIQSRPVNTPNKYQVMHEEFKNLIESILERAEEGKAKLPSNAGDADKGALGSLQPVFLKSCKMVDRAYKSDGKLRGKRLFHIMHGIYELIPGSDAELVKLANAYCRKRSLEINSLNPTNFNPTKEELLYFKKLEPIRSFNITLLQIRLFMLRQINAMVMPYGTAVVDLSRTQVAGSLAQKFHKIRDLIFWNHKHKFIQKVLMATKGDSSDHPALRLRLDKMRANRKKNSVDMMGRYTLFGQAFRQLRHSDCFLLKPLSHHKAFKVEFIGMHAIDAGGPYRQAITELCHEIQSFKLPLFIPTRNNLNKIGSGRDHWIPNPASTKPTQLRMFEFVGKLMGMAFRVEHYLELDLPAIFWKHLVESEPSLMDLKLIDLNQYKLLKKLDSKRLAPGLDFTVVGSDGRVVELVPDGASKKVSTSNYDEFMKLAKDARLNEFKIQCAAIRRGLTAVVPMSALSLLTHEELETSICGVHEIDVDLLERNTAYGGCKESDPHIRLFWRMMREAFSNEDRIHLLQFAWARSRLPTGDNWRERFHIEMTKGGDNAFPTAHTCFFMLQLPAYTNYETMCQKVKYAITHCTAIDGDHSYNAASHIELEEMEGDDDE
uniref:Uncharacterized protein n=1 Tax=Lotharella globosa TaxID=91324 RepID=A0A7S4DLT3_9EUKA